MEGTILQKSYMKRACTFPPNKHGSYSVLKSTKREDEVCPTCSRNGDLCIIYRCALYCRFPRKHPHCTKEKSLLFELHEISSRLKQWDMNFKCNSYCYWFCLLRRAISHSSIQKGICQSVMVGRDRVYHFNMCWKVSSSTSGSCSRSSCLLKIFWITIHWPSVAIRQLFVHDIKQVIWILPDFWFLE